MAPPAPKADEARANGGAGDGVGVGPVVEVGVADTAGDAKAGAVVVDSVDDPNGAVVPAGPLEAAGPPLQAPTMPRMTRHTSTGAAARLRVRSMLAILPAPVLKRRWRGVGRAIQGGTLGLHDAAMDTTKDVAICALVACYLFLAVTLDLRLLVLPSVVALGAAVAGSVAGRRTLDRP